MELVDDGAERGEHRYERRGHEGPPLTPTVPPLLLLLLLVLTPLLAMPLPLLGLLALQLAEGMHGLLVDVLAENAVGDRPTCTELLTEVVADDTDAEPVRGLPGRPGFAAQYGVHCALTESAALPFILLYLSGLTRTPPFHPSLEGGDNDRTEQGQEPAQERG
ncbi:hypothetical protein ACFWWC_34970 [Streptomyces sp. NPDC058642]|uniref:hypothetical protein n=1 Tax=Streptomyces sp. NPDC058642 TaxID=3346572 RepID=UPI0036496C22